MYQMLSTQIKVKATIPIYFGGGGGGRINDLHCKTETEMPMQPTVSLIFQIVFDAITWERDA